jgi:glyoxylate/hydroxypyruvate reductase A
MGAGAGGMNVLLCGDFDPGEEAQWRSALGAVMPGVQWLDLAAARARSGAVRAAVVANPPPGSLQGLPALRLVQSLWAGVDRLLRDPTLPADVPLARMVDPGMTAAMVETALWAVLSLHRGFFEYGARQRRGEWRAHAQRPASDVPLLVLGQGAIGLAVAQRLAAQGYPLRTWRRADGDAALWNALPAADIVIDLLPLTPATAGLLDARFFSAMRPGASLVNLARGAHVVDADLLAALDTGQVRHAVLDVFNVEPLPASHPYWQHAGVTLLPHAAAMTDPRTAAGVVAENLGRLEHGQPLLHLVERSRGY